MADCKLIRKSVKVDEDTTYTNFYLKFNGVDKLIQIKPSFKDSKSDFILLFNLSEKVD